ncbi:MAG TPA: VCBS repeat-containing protein [Pirellulaceae bacterium]|nr:VCBS repeat-containing protein [Pirellulaceae bacterium]
MRWSGPASLLGLSCLALFSPSAPATADEPKFEKVVLTKTFYCEGAHFGDFDADGSMDVVSGPYWYRGPKFEERFEIYPVEEYPVDGYSRNFSAFTGDFDADGWTDVFVVGFPGDESWWFRNPQGKTEGHWDRHVAVSVTDNESPWIVDVNGDGRLDLAFHTGGYYGYATYDQADPTAPWTFHRVSQMVAGGRFQHGFGVGDVDGDGRSDLLFQNGWLQQPEDLAGDPEWKLHAFPFAPGQGGAHMHVYDFDGDGLNDVLTSLEAHAYGLSWYRQVRDEAGNIGFEERKILGRTPEENAYGICFTQMHSIDLADMDNDGLKDIVTGKRYWAHNGNDPGAREPAVLYWFRTVRRDDGTVDFVPHLIDDDCGVGTQVIAGDLTGDGRPDVVVGNKKGTHVLLSR